MPPKAKIMAERAEQGIKVASSVATSGDFGEHGNGRHITAKAEQERKGHIAMQANVMKKSVYHKSDARHHT